MIVNRVLLPAVLLAVALVIQVSALARLQLPGAVPDLTMLVVVALAIVYGPMAGSVVGFAAGLLTDISPPSDHAAGRFALVLCLIGYLAGLVKPENGQLRSIAKPMFVVAAAAVTSTLLHAGVGSLVGDTAAGDVGLTGLTLSALLYDLLLAPFVVPWVMALARRLERDPVATGDSGASSSAASGWLSTANGRGGRFTSTGRLNGTGRLPRNGRSRSGLLLGKSGRRP
nr:rod shape-determining protein MreD [Wenjunlia vitaminophila]